MATAGTILVELGIDDSGMPVVIRRAVDSLRGLQGTLNQTAGSVKKLEEHNASLATKFRHLVMTMGNLRFVAMDINDIFLRMPIAILKTAGELERTQLLMTGLSKETSKAAKEAEGLKNFNFVTNLSKQAPFDIAALSDSFVKLKTAGMDPTKGSMVALVDSVARFGGTSESLKRASVAIQQMSGKGVISMEELRQQLGEAVPTAMKDMADGMGVSMQELAKIVQTGTLAAGPALEKMFLQMRVNNQGAADEMMKTWSGTLSRLKTEWDLAAKFIADNGFGDAAKGAVNQLGNALKSADFKRFAADAGNSLGNVVNMLTSGVGVLVKYRDEVKLLAEAWIAYKVIFSVIPGLSTALGASYTSLAGKMSQERNMLSMVKAQKVDNMVQDVVQAKAREAQTVVTLNGYKMEAQAALVKNAQIMASEAQLAEAIMLSRGGVRMAGFAQLQSQAAAGAELQRLGLATAAQTARQAELAAATVIVADTLAVQAAATARAEAALLVLANTTRLQAAAATVAAAAARGLSLVYAALGGPVGIGILAIMGLVYAWNKVSGAADEAAARQRRAAAGTTNADEQKDNIEALQLAEQKLGFIRRANAAPTPQAKSGTQLTEEATRLSEAEAAVAAARKTASLGAKAVAESASSDRVGEINLRARRVTDAIKDAATIELNKMKESQEKKLETMKAAGLESSEEYKKINNASVAQQQQLRIYEIKARAKSEKEYADAAGKAAVAPGVSGVEQAAQLEVSRQRRAAADQLTDEAKQLEHAVAVVATYTPKGDKGDGAKGESKYEKFIEDLKEKKAKVDAQLKGLLDSKHKADEVLIALAEFDQRAKNGDLNVRGKGKGANDTAPSAAQLGAAKAMAEEVAMKEVVAKDIGKVANFINKLEPDFKHAQALMKDPFGTPDQKKTNKFDEFLTTLSMTPGALEAEAKKFNIEVDKYVALVKDARDKVEFMDLSAATVKLAEDTRKLVESNSISSANLISDEREKARALYEINEKSINDANDQAIRKARSAGVETSALEAAMKEATFGRARSLAKQLESPMDKLANDWKFSTTKMEEASASWANSTVDMLVNAASTGKLEFKSLVASIASDMLKLQLKDMLASPMKSMMSGATSWIGNIMPSFAAPAANAAASLATSDPAAEAAMAAARSTFRMSEAATAAKDSLGTMTADGVNASTQALVTGVAAQGQQAIASGTFSGSIGIATTAVYGFAAALQASAATTGGSAGGGLLGTLLSVGLSSFAPGTAAAAVGNVGAIDYSLPTSGVRFADGGIMTNMGSIPLRKYAAGGIARSPQLAMYGEAGPEAYVPLPDGRSIPVTMSGGQGGSNVTIQINVNAGGSGGEDKTNASEEGSGWRKMAEKVRSVVREEMVNNQRPGGLLYK